MPSEFPSSRPLLSAASTNVKRRALVKLSRFKWSDAEWLNGKLTVVRGIVRLHVDDVKTEASQSRMSINAGWIEDLKVWKQTTQFSAQEHWIFAAPVQLGRL